MQPAGLPLQSFESRPLSGCCAESKSGQLAQDLLTALGLRSSLEGRLEFVW